LSAVDEERVRRVVRRLWVAVLAAAVIDAVRNDRNHGELFGVIPYDFRFPDIERAKRQTWDPQSTRILTPRTFGVGWSVNLGRLARLAGIV
jgi:Family of unknown function (DUF5808)